MKEQGPSAESIFATALDIADPIARSAFLANACADDDNLRREVESLLHAHDQAATFLVDPAAVSHAETVAIPALEQAGDRIGRYKLLEQIGQGGFGTVWMAEQEEPVRRRVALKIIKLGMDTREVVARFEAERQALALMEHPNIARVFDGGATQNGRPYFVMELVRGVRITDYCDEHRLSIDERLELFIQVCQAVQHAHQKGIIHRDLKPSNVLISVIDDRPVPKVIDFGIAKATAQRLTEKTLFTQFHRFVGTPAYMSPEQAGANREDIDTRSDIYSLGVLLYELLTGRTPFDTHKLLEAGYEAIQKTIREVEPPTPSNRLTSLTEEELGVIAAGRKIAPEKLGRLVRGELDWIVMKAMEKDRTRRYETANGLAADIQRRLNNETVAARPSSVAYRVSKFVRRNRTQLAFCAIALVATIVAVLGGKYALGYRFSQRALGSAGSNAVFSAASSGDAEALRRLLDANPRLVSQRGSDGSTPLSYAAGAGNTNTLHLLLSRGAVVDTTNNSGGTPLMAAAARGRVSAVAALLEAGADPNRADDKGDTALMAASLPGTAEVGRLLLAKGARVDAANLRFRTTALQQAAGFGHANFVEVLLSHGARVDSRDATGSTPLHGVALGQNVAEVFHLLDSQLSHFTARTSASQDFAFFTQNVSNQIVQLKTSLPADILRGGGEHRRVAELLLARKADLEATNTAGWTPLRVAADSTNCAVAEILIAHKANLNVRDSSGWTPLNIAAFRGGLPMVTLLLRAGADPNLRDSAGFTPLHSAIENRHRDVARALLAHKASPDLPCPRGHTPLHTAAGHGDIESMGLLLEQGAALHPLTPSGTPLAWAVQFRHQEAVEFLLRRGSKPDVPSAQLGTTALHWAAGLGYPSIVQLLLDAGASVDPTSSRLGTPLNVASGGSVAMRRFITASISLKPPNFKSRSPVPGPDEDYAAVLRALLTAKANPNVRESEFDRTPLFTAIKEGHVAAVNILLEAGADLSARDSLGTTPLHAASEMEAPVPVVSNIVTRLLRAGAPLEVRDRRLATPLHAAANAGNSIIVQLLLEAGARVNVVGPNLYTPLHLAVLRGRPEVVRLLLAKEAGLEWLDAAGATALHQAAALQAAEVFALLLQHGADPNTGSSNGSTALMIVAEAGNLSLINLLLEHGASVDASNHDGWTALMFAAKSGRIEAARLLLERGAKIDAADRYGSTPFILAAKDGRLEMAKYLLQQGAKLDSRDWSGFTALHEAADRGHAEVVEFLLARGLAVDLRENYDATPLVLCSQAKFTSQDRYAAVARVLLAHGADVNARMLGGQTPAHRAAQFGHAPVLKVLLTAHPDLSAVDQNGHTPLQLAEAKGQRDCVDLLRTHKLD